IDPVRPESKDTNPAKPGLGTCQRHPVPVKGTHPSRARGPSPHSVETEGSVCRLLVALLSLCEGLQGLPAPRLKPSDPRADFDSIISLAKNLLSDTKHLFHHFKSRYPAEGEHKMDTLPVLSMSAVELANIQVPGGLARLSADLQNYQKHLEWLRRAGSVLRPLEPDLGALHARLERLVKRLEHLMSRLNLPRPSDPLPVLPSHGTHWAVVQAGHALFHSLHLYLDWAARALVLIRNKL
ncbi:interleukin-11, partial [Trachemys scripta elegans]|uniref:interleukin-11 n=1 Tax=Trachemys scripta elegans TaxID=31138 RepID=UPI001557DC5F